MRFVAAEGRSHVTLGYILCQRDASTCFAARRWPPASSGYLPAWLTTYVGVVFTLSFVLVVPIVLGPMARLAAAVLYPILGVEGRIAQRQVLRRRVRTTLTIGLLFIAVSIAITLGTMILNNVEDIRNWQAKTFQGDFIIRTMTPDLATGATAPMPESLGNELRAIDGVANVDSIRYMTLSMHVKEPQPGKQSVMRLYPRFHRPRRPAAGHSGGRPGPGAPSTCPGRGRAGHRAGQPDAHESGRRNHARHAQGPAEVPRGGHRHGLSGRRHVGLHGRPDRPPPAGRRRRQHVHRQCPARREGAGARRD